MTNEQIVQKIWALCNVLRGDGISYREYISELTYLLFLKIAEENQTEDILPVGYRWQNLATYQGDNLLGFYQEMLTHLGAAAKSDLVRQIYAFPTTVFSHSENLRVVIDAIARIDWHSISEDALGTIYEGLLAKNSEDARSGAGQYFTPRPLVDCIIALIKPSEGDIIQDPAIGTGGFIIAADQFIRASTSSETYDKRPPLYQGMEIERGTYRLCLMNTFLHKMQAEIFLGDALTKDAEKLRPANIILANPPFGSKAGSARKSRSDIPFPSSNKQLEFLQHIYLGLAAGGRAAVVLPDNVLFDEGIGKKIRTDFLNKCNLHTILRLPTGIFYSPGVKTNVLFFSRGLKDTKNTDSVWVYDMRSNISQFGKRTPLTLKHFSDFMSSYGQDPNGDIGRRADTKNPRFRQFSRADISDNNESLYFTWSSEEETERDEPLLDPEETMESMILALESTVLDLRNMLDTVSEEN